MKTQIKKMSISLLLIFTLSAHAGLFDGPVGATEFTQLANNAELVSQVQKQIKTLTSLTKIRDSVQFSKDLTWLNKMMGEYKLDMMDLDLDNPKSIIGQEAKKLFDKYNLFDDCSYSYMSDVQKKICKNKMTRYVQQIAVYNDVNDKLTKYSAKIQKLQNAMAASKDIKESQDIGNSINNFQTLINTIIIQVELMEKRNAVIEKAEQRQLQQLQKQNSEKTGSNW
jgi:type IV secretion system protein VirB5